MAQPVFEARDLSRVFEPARGAFQRLGDHLAGRQPAPVRAVNHVTLSVLEGETLGIVGESGCGKSTLARMIAGILPISGGERRYRGEDYASFLSRKRDALKIQMVFQDPMSSLNPRLKVGEIIGEAPVLHGVVPRAQIRNHVLETLARVGLPRHERTNRGAHLVAGKILAGGNQTEKADKVVGHCVLVVNAGGRPFNSSVRRRKLMRPRGFARGLRRVGATRYFDGNLPPARGRGCKADDVAPGC